MLVSDYKGSSRGLNNGDYITVSINDKKISGNIIISGYDVVLEHNNQEFDGAYMFKFKEPNKFYWVLYSYGSATNFRFTNKKIINQIIYLM